MPEYSTTEIAAKCRVSERTIQRWIREDLLPAHEIMRNRYIVDDADIERMKPRTIQAHRDELTQRLEALEQRIAQLEQDIEQLKAKDRTKIHKPTPPVYTVETPPGKQGATPGISLQDMANELGITRTTLLGHLHDKKKGLKHHADPKPGREGEYIRWFDQEEAAALRAWHAEHTKR